MKNLYYPGPTRYKGLRSKQWASIAILVIFAAIPAAVGYQTRQYEKSLDRLGKSIQLQAYAQEKQFPIENPTSEQQQIIAYIEQVFGADAPKAFKLLTDPTCHENRSLNAAAINTTGNSPVGSKDVGVFQINEYWQKIQAKFLLNWKVNVEVAHQLYKENGNSFKLWTCGKALGI